MNARIWFHPELNLVYSQLEGRLTSAGLAALRSAIQQDPRHDPSQRHLLDFQRIDRAGLSSHEVFELSRRAVHDSQTPRALVAPQTYLYGIARMIDAWYAKTRPNSRTFKDLASARAWLGLAEDVDLEAGDPLTITSA